MSGKLLNYRGTSNLTEACHIVHTWSAHVPCPVPSHGRRRKSRFYCRTQEVCHYSIIVSLRFPRPLFLPLSCSSSVNLHNIITNGCLDILISANNECSQKDQFRFITQSIRNKAKASIQSLVSSIWIFLWCFCSDYQMCKVIHKVKEAEKCTRQFSFTSHSTPFIAFVN